MLLPWQQLIVKITIFLLFSTYLLPFLELPSVKYLQTWQSCTFLNIVNFTSFNKKQKLLDKILAKK